MKKSKFSQRLFIFFLIITFSTSGFTQSNPEIDLLIAKKQKFENLIINFEDSIVIIENQIRRLESDIYRNNIKETGGVNIVLKKGSKLKMEPEVFSKIIFTTPDTLSLLMVDVKDSYAKVIFDESIVWVHEIWLNDLSVISDFKRNRIEENKQIEDEKKQKEKIKIENLKKEERAKLVTKYGEKSVQKLEKGIVWIGMTEEMAIYSWGKPEDINQTIYSNGSVSRQYVYSNNNYLYFENGKLTTIQN